MVTNSIRDTSSRPSTSSTLKNEDGMSLTTNSEASTLQLDKASTASTSFTSTTGRVMQAILIETQSPNTVHPDFDVPENYGKNNIN